MNYYILQFKNNGAILSRMLGGQMMEISSDQTFKLEKRKWYSVKMQLKDTDIQIWAY